MSQEPSISDAARLALLLRGDVASLLSAVTRTDVESLRLEDGDVAIKIERADVVFRGTADRDGEVVTVGVGLPPIATVDDAPVGPLSLRSQSVGFFHRSRMEGVPNLVEDGATIVSGAVVAVVETLGMAGEVVSPVAGTLEFVVEDGHPVGFGDVVAIVHPR
jgi:biotin carboxyl carrier protein